MNKYLKAWKSLIFTAYLLIFPTKIIPLLPINWIKCCMFGLSTMHKCIYINGFNIFWKLYCCRTCKNYLISFMFYTKTWKTSVIRKNNYIFLYDTIWSSDLFLCAALQQGFLLYKTFIYLLCQNGAEKHSLSVPYQKN